ncbi:alpha/beta hydrolase [Rarobacter faecitabidus]|nr:alpha/beta hydrolase [Rarobacter faecitabidus]
MLPNSSDPHPELWDDAIRTAVGTPDKDSIIIAHSLGCLAVLRYLRSLTDPWRLGTLVLVSGFMEPLPALPELDAYIGKGCDVTCLEGRVGRTTAILSDNEPYVPPTHTERLADLVGASLQVIHGAGHFLADDGVTALPEVSESILA